MNERLMCCILSFLSIVPSTSLQSFAYTLADSMSLNVPLNMRLTECARAYDLVSISPQLQEVSSQNRSGKSN